MTLRPRRLAARQARLTDAALHAVIAWSIPSFYGYVAVIDDVDWAQDARSAVEQAVNNTIQPAQLSTITSSVPESNAVEVPEDLDPAEVVSLVFPYMTAYQLLHRVAMVESGETVLVHGAAGRVGTAVLELGALAGLRIYGTASARDRAAVERLGAVAIDYRNEDFVARVRELTGQGVDVALDGLGGVLSLRSFRALRPGGRLVVYGHYNTLVQGRKSWRGWIEWYAATATVWLWGLLSPRRRVLAYRIQKLRGDRHQVLPVGGGPRALPVGGGPRYPDWFREDFLALLELLRADKIHPVVAERLPLSDARRAHELLERLAATGKLVLVP